MLIKVYTRKSPQTPGPLEFAHEELHIVENAQDVIIHQGNWGLPSWVNAPVTDIESWGPEPHYLPLEQFEADLGDTVRLIDYTQNNIRKRALIKLLAYVCNENGKTIEKVEAYSGARLSVHKA